jgi:hypothetical protein
MIGCVHSFLCEVSESKQALSAGLEAAIRTLSRSPIRAYKNCLI